MNPEPIKPRLKQEHVNSLSNARIAFIVIGSLGLLYFDYMMLEELITPFFWAFMVAVFLRQPRDALINLLQGLVPPSKNGDVGSHSNIFYVAAENFFNLLATPYHIFTRFILIIKVLGRALLNSKQKLIIYSTVLILYLAVIIGVSMDPFIILVIVLLHILIPAIAIVFLLVMDVRTFVASALIIITLVMSIALSSFFIVQCTREVHFAAVKVQESFQSGQFDPYLKSFNITQENVNQTMEMGKDFLKDLYNATFGSDNVPEILKDEKIRKFAEDAVKWVENVNLNSSSQSWYQQATDMLHNFDWNSLEFDYQILYDLLPKAGEALAQVGTFGFSTLLTTLSTVISILNSSINQALNLITFLFSLFSLLQSDTFVLQAVISLIPGEDAQKQVMERCMNYINGIFITTILTAISQGFVTAIVYWVLDFPFLHLATLLSALIVPFPIFPPQAIFFPILIHLYWQGSWLFAIVLITGITLILNTITDTLIEGFVQNFPPYLTGIAIALGTSVFGFNGIVLGPLLFFFTLVAYEVIVANPKEILKIDSGVVKKEIKL